MNGTLYAGGNKGEGVYKLVGDTWVAAGTDLPANIDIYSLSYVDGTLYAAAEGGEGVYKRVGDTWEAAGTGLPAGSQFYALLNVGGTLYAGGDRGLFILKGDRFLKVNNSAYPGMQVVSLLSYTHNGVNSLVTGTDSGVFFNTLN